MAVLELSLAIILIAGGVGGSLLISADETAARESIARRVGRASAAMGSELHSASMTAEFLAPAVLERGCSDEVLDSLERERVLRGLTFISQLRIICSRGFSQSASALVAAGLAGAAGGSAWLAETREGSFVIEFATLVNGAAVVLDLDAEFLSARLGAGAYLLDAGGEQLLGAPGDQLLDVDPDILDGRVALVESEAGQRIATWTPITETPWGVLVVGQPTSAPWSAELVLGVGLLAGLMLGAHALRRMPPPRDILLRAGTREMTGLGLSIGLIEVDARNRVTMADALFFEPREFDATKLPARLTMLDPAGAAILEPIARSVVATGQAWAGLLRLPLREGWQVIRAVIIADARSRGWRMLFRVETYNHAAVSHSDEDLSRRIAEGSFREIASSIAALRSLLAMPLERGDISGEEMRAEFTRMSALLDEMAVSIMHLTRPPAESDDAVDLIAADKARLRWLAGRDLTLGLTDRPCDLAGYDGGRLMDMIELSVARIAGHTQEDSSIELNVDRGKDAMLFEIVFAPGESASAAEIEAKIGIDDLAMKADEIGARIQLAETSDRRLSLRLGLPMKAEAEAA